MLGTHSFEHTFSYWLKFIENNNFADPISYLMNFSLDFVVFDKFQTNGRECVGNCGPSIPLIFYTKVLFLLKSWLKPSIYFLKRCLKLRHPFSWLMFGRPLGILLTTTRLASVFTYICISISQNTFNLF